MLFGPTIMAGIRNVVLSSKASYAHA
jgi:hypothetical protein